MKSPEDKQLAEEPLTAHHLGEAGVAAPTAEFDRRRRHRQ